MAKSKSHKGGHHQQNVSGAGGMDTAVQPLAPPATASISSVLKKKKQGGSAFENWVVKPCKNNPLAILITLLSIAITIVATMYSPLGTDQFAYMWYKQGGQLLECNKGLALAMAASDLACHKTTRRADGSIDRGLMGFNSKNSSDVPDSCAYDCVCSIQRAVRILRSKVEWPDTPADYDREKFESYVQQAATPCNKVAEELIKQGYTVSQIAGGAF